MKQSRVSLQQATKKNKSNPSWRAAATEGWSRHGVYFSLDLSTASQFYPEFHLTKYKNMYIIFEIFPAGGGNSTLYTVHWSVG